MDACLWCEPVSPPPSYRCTILHACMPVRRAPAHALACQPARTHMLTHMNTHTHTLKHKHTYTQQLTHGKLRRWAGTSENHSKVNSFLRDAPPTLVSTWTCWPIRYGALQLLRCYWVDKGLYSLRFLLGGSGDAAFLSAHP